MVKTITHSGGSTSGSVVAQKMFKHDSNLDNWLFSWCETKEKTLAISMSLSYNKKCYHLLMDCIWVEIINVS